MHVLLAHQSFELAVRVVNWRISWYNGAVENSMGPNAPQWPLDDGP